MKKIKDENTFSIDNFKKLCDLAESYGIMCKNCEHYTDNNDCEETYMFCEEKDFCNYFVPKFKKEE